MTVFDTEQVNLSTASMKDIAVHLEFAERVASHDNFIHADWYHDFFPVLSICRFDHVLDTPPPILLVGSQSSQTQIFGDDWCKNILITRQTPAEDLEESKATIIGYQNALKYNTSTLEFCTSTITEQNHDRIVHYYKTVARIRTNKGLDLYAYLGTLIDPVLQ
ncbi:MAG: hypothetical protein JKX91_06705 [Rhizobiaceae bacterium]|nr:hypothetical protein [Rhizobiaceae bacterium]